MNVYIVYNTKDNNKNNIISTWCERQNKLTVQYHLLDGMIGPSGLVGIESISLKLHFEIVIYHWVMFVSFQMSVECWNWKPSKFESQVVKFVSLDVRLFHCWML